MKPNEAVSKHWPLPDRDTTRFPTISADGELSIKHHLAAILNLDGVGWQDYQEQRIRSGLDVEDSRLRTYRKMYERLGLIYPKSNLIRLSALGRPMRMLLELPRKDHAQALPAIKTQALRILARYQLRNPAEQDSRNLDESCDVFPFQCIWRAMLALDSKLHIEEVNRVLLRVLSMSGLGPSIDRIREARERLHPYGAHDESTLSAFLGEPVMSDQPQARIAALYSLAGWGGMVIEPHNREDGFRHLTSDILCELKQEVTILPVLRDIQDVDEWFAFYSGWAEPEASAITNRLELRCRERLNAYRESPRDVVEHANIERSTAQGGYGRRQLYELVQNGADELLGFAGGRIKVVLTNDALYCANEGSPITEDGMDVLLSSHVSFKRGTEIGRFGLGFKSVLGVSTCPECYSRSGSFGFSATASEECIRAIVPSADRYPVLRIASMINPQEAATSDQTLRSLMAWADTVIRLPLDIPDAHWLQEDVATFPSEFLLFCPQVGSLTLEDSQSDYVRNIAVTRRKNEVISLKTDGNNSTEWMVFETVYSPSSEARRSAGELADRESIPLMWAVPLQGRTNRGVFWAFFPTNNITSLSGIINAPWKTNEDRQNLLDGSLLNVELIDRTAELVVDSLPRIVEPDDPAGYLDLLPGRTKEHHNWADLKLNIRVYEIAAARPSLPNMEGVLFKPSELKLHPPNLSAEALRLWRSYPAHPTGWCHHDVDASTARRSRVERLLELNGRRAESVAVWLESLAASATPEASTAALAVAAELYENGDGRIKASVRQARILLTENGGLVAPIPGTVFLKHAASHHCPSLTYAHDAIAASEQARKACETIGVSEVEASSELEAMLATQNLQLYTDISWERFWRLVGQLDTDKSVEIIKAHVTVKDRHNIHIRTLGEQFRPLNSVLIPGTVVPEDGSRDADVTVDLSYHKQTISVIRELGAVDAPRLGSGNPCESWFSEYLSAAIVHYSNNLPAKSKRPRVGHLEFGDRPIVGPMLPIFDLSPDGRAAFTGHVLLASDNEIPWTLSHSTRSDYYKPQNYVAPQVWLLRKEGYLRTSLGVTSVRDCVGPALANWSKILPVAECTPHHADLLRLPGDLQGLSEHHWKDAFSRALELDDEESVGAFYSVACITVAAPQKIACRVNGKTVAKKPSMVTVASNPDDCRAMDLLRDTPYLTVPSDDDAKRLSAKWGLQPAHLAVKWEIRPVPSGPSIPIADKFLGISVLLSEDQSRVVLVPCSSIRRENATSQGAYGSDVTIEKDGDCVYYTDQTSGEQLLDSVAQLLDLHLEDEDRRAILEDQSLAELRERTHKVRMKSTLEDKLLEAVGLDAIKSRLPRSLLQAVENELGGTVNDPSVLAKLVIAVYGVETLRLFKDDLKKKQLEPPVQWAGSHVARKFVKSLGFPDEFAGFKEASRDAVVEIDGPRKFPPLHSYQEEIVANIRSLIGKTSRKRALLSLPTGAGKTRVAVESLTRALNEGNLTSPVIWIAQSGELCEQAVQTWSEVWRAVGPDQQLCINRLWATNEADAYSDGAQVVVATIDKLRGCVEDDSYDWLRAADCIIIDEAHRATTPEYTKVLEWQGLGRGKDSKYVIGLTATPFRGGEEETRDLANRFFGNRLDVGVFGNDPYRELQLMRVLAEVDHELLEGIEVRLSDDELAQLNRLGRLPVEAEGRIGADTARNRTLLESICGLDTSWPVLLFAVSVDHARTMAALLNSRGVSAAAISAETDPGARRYYIERFRRGDLRVLANYNVLTAGFDAPAVRAVYVARPTFSPGLYQQMIGRGLRGPENRGKERCLIVNVADNFAQYGEELAFREFEYLWNREETAIA